jgi:FixJ family two-component response regulator
MSGKDIVVVEDDSGLRQALQKLLNAAGYRPAAFESAEALLASGDVDRAGCLVLDIRLPGTSGIELYRQIAARGAAPPVIFITAHDQPALREEAAKLGAAAYLPKPFPGRDLVEAVAAAVGAELAS